MKNSKPLGFALLAGVACCVLFLATAAEQAATPAPLKKIVFIAGNPSHGPGEHEHRAGCILLASQLEKAGMGFQTVVTTNGWPADESIFEGASAIVIYSDGGDNHPAMNHLEKLSALGKAGVGIGCIHYGVEIPAGNPGDVLLDSIGGFFEENWSVNPIWDAAFVMPDHPIARGVKDFSIRDEWYYHMRFRKDMEGVTPILTALPPSETLSQPDGTHSGNPAVRKAVLEDKLPQHMMWALDRPASLGGGRGFGFTGGHYHKNWQQDDHRRVVLNAIAWIANSEIPDTGIPSQTPTDTEMQANLDPK